jgi:hypothetical protein
MTLEDWFLFSVPVTDGEDFESTERASVLAGWIYRHPERPDGSFFISDGLVAANHPAGVVATQAGLVLSLGKVSRSCEMIFPGIRDYVLTGLPQDGKLAAMKAVA